MERGAVRKMMMTMTRRLGSAGARIRRDKVTGRGLTVFGRGRLDDDLIES